MIEKIKHFRRLVLASTLATYLLIFIGGLVRVSGAGLGCPDWPKCFGRWFPPLSLDQVPPEFNAATFNITLAWIEYINRLAGMLTGILIAITAFLALKNFRDKKNILYPSVLAALLVAFQGWYGSIVVKSQLLPVTISVHLLIALAIVSLLLYTLINVSFSGKPLAGDEVRPLRNLLRILWLATMIQIAIGTEIRSAIERIWQEFPLLAGSEVLLQTGSIVFIHALLGVLLSTGAVLISIRLVKTLSENGIVKRTILLLNGLLLIQLLLGFALQIVGIAPFFQLFHLWVASLSIGLILVIYTGLLYKQEML